MKKLLNRYGIFGLMNLIISLIFTKLLFRDSRIIRFPFDIRGRKFIDLGLRLTTGKNCRIEAFSLDSDSTTIFFGNDVQLNDYVHITAMKSVRIGNNVLMASKIYISDCTHGYYSGDFTHSHPDLPPMEREYSIKPVVIQDNVWIGESVSVLPGVTIGKGSIIGANSVVSKDIPDYTIAVGIPAKAIKKFNFETLIWENI
jgi:acetyltransferase-like isoleucine patch superfamily enzyme